MAKSLNCPNCAAAFDPKDNSCAYCGSYIITSKAKQITYNLDEQEPKYKKIFFHGNEMREHEIPIRSGFANMFYSITRSDGGRLLLTNQRLIFCVHAINLNPHLYWELDLKEIDRTELGLNLFISQRFHIFEREENETIFVVYGGKHWLNELTNALEKISE
ncbi:hypothetical protein ABH966_002501 [Lysinibacillus sp. RC46]|uniref:hypothetical protein n=1 Tax=unclassified Lysinibacillus TaxID=2636778 RepID=UPI003514CB09